ncbi:MAG: SusC/RagA family TonB-linked outer membrane protein [Bacteroidota bacterium]
MINNYLKNKKWVLLSFALMAFQTYSYATRLNPGHLALLPVLAAADSIAGTTLDNNGKPLANVKVVNLSRGNSSLSNAKGKFLLTGQAGDRLSFEHPEYYYQEISWNGKQNFITQLSGKFLPVNNLNANRKDTSLRNDPTAYIDVLHGRQLKQDVLQSISTVNTNQLTTSPSSQFLQALPGRLAGLNISFTNGAPGLDGNGLSYNVRSARGANIILIDGVQRSFLSIDPEQIESISVLKDALSTAMYGMRSANGIISITTKKGNRGAPRISFSAQTAIQRPTALPKPLSADQYATLYNEAQQNDAGTATITPRYSAADILAYQNGSDLYGHPNVNWYNTVLKNQSALQKYNFNVQGSGDNFRYFVDVDNLKETGLLKTIDSNVYNTNAQLDRYLVRANLGIDVTKTTTMQLNLFGRIERNNQPGGGSAGIFAALANTPQNAYPVFNTNGSLAGTSGYGGDVNIYGQTVNRGYQFQDARDMAIDLQVTQKLDIILPGLYAKVQGSYNNSTLYTTSHSKDFAVYQLLANGNYTMFGTNTAQVSTGTPNARTRVTYFEGNLGYDKSIGKHNFGALLVADQQSTLPFDTGNLPENYTDFAARLTYNWDDKYLLEGAGSYAGYSYYAPAKRWANYGAVGIGWNVHREDFIKNNFKFISNLKLRATYGLTGQANNAGYYSYIQSYWTPSSNTNNNDGYYFGSTGVGVERSTGQNSPLANPDLGPEKAKKTNAGIDIGFFNNKLAITAEYFKNRFYDLVATPGTQTLLLGTGYPSKNLQKFDYWGSDITVTYQDKVKNFNYYITGNFSLVQSKVVFNDEVAKAYDYQRSTGSPVGIQFGYIATGLFQSYAEINDPKTAVFASTPKSTLRPGDIRYMDRNGDGIIDNNDNGIIGNGKPIVYYGTTFGFSYKGIDVSILFQGTLNRQSYLNGDFMNGFGNGGVNNAYEYNLNRWTPATAATATAPRVYLGTNTNNSQTSSYWLRNSDFIRLKNAELGYTIPAVLTRKIGVPSVRLFTNGLNLVTWSKVFKTRDDIDPEAVGSTYPIMRVINFGITAKF